MADQGRGWGRRALDWSTEGQGDRRKQLKPEGRGGGRQKERGDTQSVVEVGRLKARHPRDCRTGLVCKIEHRGPMFYPQNPQQRACAWNPSTKEEETGKPLQCAGI